MANMTRRQFAQSSFHQAILVEAAKQLGTSDPNCRTIHKASVMQAVGDVAMIDHVRWDYVTEAIEQTLIKMGLRAPLIPVAERFFKASVAEKTAMVAGYKFKHEPGFPGKYVAHGQGKKTAGWVLSTFADGRFALYKAELMRASSNGKLKALEDFGSAVIRELHSGGKSTEIANVAGVSLPPKAP